MKEQLPERFHPAYYKISSLQRKSRYVGAFIFGSVARGDTNNQSDFDVKVIINTYNPCPNINHPFINGIKLDVQFQSFEQLNEFTNQEIGRAERIPMIDESIIIFDKTGRLTSLKEKAFQAEAKKDTPENYQYIQFMVYHANDKVERYLESYPESALLSMEIGVNELLKIHYHIHGKWWVSNKRLLSDLEQWDPVLKQALERFAKTSNLKKKFTLWKQVIEHILEPIGGRQPIIENNCCCEVCSKDLEELLTY